MSEATAMQDTREHGVVAIVMPPVLLGIDDAARAIGVSPRTLHDLVNKDQIPVVRVGGGKRAGRVLFRPESLRAWAERMEVGGQGAANPAAG